MENGIRPETGIGQTAYTGVTMNLPDEAKTLKLLMKEGEKVQMSTEIPKTLTAPVKAGTVIGSVIYYLEEEPVKVFPVYAKDDVDEVTLRWCIANILDKFLICPDIP